MAASASPPPLLLRALSSHNPHGGITSTPRLFVCPTAPSSLLLRAPPRRSSVATFARWKKTTAPSSRRKPPNKKGAWTARAVRESPGGGRALLDFQAQHTTKQIADIEGGAIGEDAFEALFNQLEEDLKNDNLTGDDTEGNDLDEDAFEALFTQLEKDLKSEDLSDIDADDDETSGDLVKLEQELEDALSGDDADDFSGVPSLNSDDEAEEEEPSPKLKNWQLRRLARAVKVGRRKTSIKILAAELGLDRAFVLELLRNPPPNLLLMSASIPDEVAQVPPEPENNATESSPVAKSKPEAGVPIHVIQSRWSMQKRLKKVQVETLERVYARTKRPTNAMISSIVHVTNLPSKRVVQWFEEKRVEDGVPDKRLPFRRSKPEAITAT